MKRENIETIVWVFCILVMLWLTTKIYIESNEYDCSQCSIDLVNILAIGKETYTHENISILKLIEAYKEGECLFVWDSVQGYMKNGY